MADINKSTIIKEISKELNMPEENVKKVVDAFIKIIKQKMLDYKSVLITGFGTFFLRKANPKQVTDFQSNMRKVTESRELPKCNFSQKFKNDIKK